MQQMGQQQPGTYNPMMVDWDMKDWTQYNMMNQQGSQNSNSAMWMDGDMSDYMMWQSLMNSQNQNQKPSGPRGNAIEQMEKMALCMEYLKSLNGNQALKTDAYSALVSQLALKASSVVRTIEETDELTFFRIRSKMHEIMIAPDKEYLLIVIQNPNMT